MKPKRIILLGSTGSIGENALRLFRSVPGRFEVVGLAAGKNFKRLAEQAAEFNCARVAIADESVAYALRADLPRAAEEVMSGPDASARLASETNADIVLCAISGMAALRPVLAALESGKDVALATKEVLVSAGSLVLETAHRNNVAILPVDSEHSAILQALGTAGIVPPCLRGRAASSGALRPISVTCSASAPSATDSDTSATSTVNSCATAATTESEIEKLWLTASGGPFFFKKDFDPAAVTPTEALAHPKWKMGPKVSIDSSTMMNKGLEIIEAARLFGVPQSRIGVLIHPQSIVHSLVEFRDGAQLAQLGAPDMRLPLQYALTWPDREPNYTLPRLDLAHARSLEFLPPDEHRFPCIALAREAEGRGPLVPCAMNAADEVAVARFLSGEIRWSDIARIVESAMNRAPSGEGVPSLDEIIEIDLAARAFAEKY